MAPDRPRATPPGGSSAGETAIGAGRGVPTLRVGVDEAFATAGVDPQVSAALDAALATLGEELVPCRMPAAADLDRYLAAAGTVCSYEAARAHRRLGAWPGRANAYGKFAVWLRAGDAISDEQYAAALAEVSACRAVVDRMFAESRLDAFGCPPMPVPLFDAFPDLDTQPTPRVSERHRFTVPFSCSGHPTVTVPVGFDAAGRPLAAQLVAARGAEELLCVLAARVEARFDGVPTPPAAAGACSGLSRA